MQYPVVESLCAGIAVVLFLIFGLSVDFVELLIFSLLMLLVAIIDYRQLIVPNQLVAFGLLAGVTLELILSHESLPESLLGALLAFLLMAGIRFAGNLAFKKESMGMGDVKLAGVIGLFLSFSGFLVSLWFASIGGLLLTVIRIRRGNGSRFTIHDSPHEVLNSTPKPHTFHLSPFTSHQLSDSPKLPFGSFLASSSIIVLIFQSQISEFLESWLTLTP